MTIPSSAIEIGTVVALFGALLGCYLFVFNTRGEMHRQVRELQQCVDDRLSEVQKESARLSDSLSKDINNLALQLTNRLTAIETILKGRKEE